MSDRPKTDDSASKTHVKTFLLGPTMLRIGSLLNTQLKHQRGLPRANHEPCLVLKSSTFQPIDATLHALARKSRTADYLSHEMATGLS